MKRNFPIWQITLPLSVVLIFAIGAFTTIYMTNGGYIFLFEATPKKVRIRTDIDKRNTQLVEKTTKHQKAEISQNAK